MKEPLRLCDGDELPASLRDAFRALERELPSADMVARVQHTLQALPAAAPGAVAVSALGTGKLLVLSTLLVGTVTSFLALRGEPAPISAKPPRQPTAFVESATPHVDQPAAPRATRAPSPARVAAAESLAPSVAASAPTRPPREQPVAQAGKRLGTSSSASSFAHMNGGAGKARAASGVTPRATPEPTAATQQVAPAAAEPTPSAPDPDAAGAQASEARMLAQAKRLAAREPEAALRQLQTLSAQFPAGLFVQERELLAIQLHRELGHTALVEQLTRQFQERYPRSLYRRALPP